MEKAFVEEVRKLKADFVRIDRLNNGSDGINSVRKQISKTLAIIAAHVYCPEFDGKGGRLRVHIGSYLPEGQQVAEFFLEFWRPDEAKGQTWLNVKVDPEATWYAQYLVANSKDYVDTLPLRFILPLFRSLPYVLEEVMGDSPCLREFYELCGEMLKTEEASDAIDRAESSGE